MEGPLAPIVDCCFPQASQLDSFSYEDGADRAARLQARRREQAAAQEAAHRQYEAQRQEARRLRGTGFSSIKEVDNSWSRFGFVPKPSNAVGDAAGCGVRQHLNKAVKTEHSQCVATASNRVAS